MKLDSTHAIVRGTANYHTLIDKLKSVGIDASKYSQDIPSNNSGVDANADVVCKRSAFLVDGMTCASCVATIEKYLGNQEGVVKVGVNLLTKRADVEFDPKRIDEQQIKVCATNSFCFQIFISFFFFFIILISKGRYLRHWIQCRKTK